MYLITICKKFQKPFIITLINIVGTVLKCETPKKWLWLIGIGTAKKPREKKLLKKNKNINIKWHIYIQTLANIFSISIQHHLILLDISWHFNKKEFLIEYLMKIYGKFIRI